MRAKAGKEHRRGRHHGIQQVWRDHVRGRVHHGVELGAVASIRTQLQGGRILVMAKLDEVQSFLTRSEMSDAKLDLTACGSIVVSMFA